MAQTTELGSSDNNHIETIKNHRKQKGISFIYLSQALKPVNSLALENMTEP